MGLEVGVTRRALVPKPEQLGDTLRETQAAVPEVLLVACRWQQRPAQCPAQGARPFPVPSEPAGGLLSLGAGAGAGTGDDVQEQRTFVPGDSSTPASPDKLFPLRGLSFIDCEIKAVYQPAMRKQAVNTEGHLRPAQNGDLNVEGKPRG